MAYLVTPPHDTVFCRRSYCPPPSLGSPPPLRLSFFPFLNPEVKLQLLEAMPRMPSAAASHYGSTQAPADHPRRITCMQLESMEIVLTKEIYSSAVLVVPRALT